MTPDQVRLLKTVETHLEAGRVGEAQAVLDQFAEAAADEPRVWWNRATIAQIRGDALTAETALRRTADLDRKTPFAHTALGDLLLSQKRDDEAVEAWRTALKRDPKFAPAALNLAELLVETGDAEGALAVLAPLRPSQPDPALHSLRAAALNQLGRTAEALVDYRATVTASRGAPSSVQNLAAALLAAGRSGEAEAETRKALAATPGAPGLWQTLAAVLVQDRPAEAQEALQQGLAKDPRHPGCHRDLAQLIWMRTGDVAAATAALDRVLASEPGLAPLLITKAKLLETAGDLNGAVALLEAPAGQLDAPNYLRCAASQLLVHSDPGRAVSLAASAVARAPRDAFGLAVLAQAQLAAGDADGAGLTAARLRQIAPLDQHGLALQATAWRLTGDARYGELYDYDALVRASVIETPTGWPDLDSYLADLAVALEALQPFKAEPVGQSVRGGIQTSASLEASDDPAIRALFKAIDAPIRAYIAGLGQGDDPLRSRIGKGYRLAGYWSVKLSPGGSHVDHLHHKGWISSAFYVRLPASVTADGHQGSLRFGRPGTPTQPEAPAEHRIKPQPGLLALFPSYMWHGTEAFDGDATRLTVAFDIVPA